MLLARIYEAFPLTCPPCGTQMRMVAFIAPRRPRCSGSSTPSVSPLRHRGLPQREGHRHGRKRTAGPSLSMTGASAPIRLLSSNPEYEFDQRITW